MQLVKEKAAYERAVVSRDEALGMFQENKFKVRPLCSTGAKHQVNRTAHHIDDLSGLFAARLSLMYE